jgi:SMC interacting uncharacterized protein involved in chromosome segregation
MIMNDAAEQMLNSLMESIDKLNKGMEAIKKEGVGLGVEIATLISEIEMRKRESEGLGLEIATLNKELEGLGLYISTINKGIEARRTEFEGLSDNISMLTRKFGGHKVDGTLCVDRWNPSSTQFKIAGNLIVKKGEVDRWDFLFIHKVIPKYRMYSFKLKIVSTRKRQIDFGIVDRNT